MAYPQGTSTSRRRCGAPRSDTSSICARSFQLRHVPVISLQSPIFCGDSRVPFFFFFNACFLPVQRPSSPSESPYAPVLFDFHVQEMASVQAAAWELARLAVRCSPPRSPPRAPGFSAGFPLRSKQRHEDGARRKLLETRCQC